MDGPTDYSRLSTEAVLTQLKSRRQGLTPAEAAKRLQQIGPNALRYSQAGWLGLALGRVAKNSFVLILLAATLAAVHLGDGHVVLALVVALAINVAAEISSVAHGYRFAQHLNRLLGGEATVLRGGRHHTIPAQELTPGDIVFLEQGSHVPADLRLIEASRLVLDEHELTGSSRHVSKETRIGNKNLAWLGTTVVGGQGRGIVIATGSQSRFGERLDTPAKLMATIATPSQQRLDFIKLHVAQASFLLAAVLVIFALASGVTARDFWTFFAMLAVALVPTGLAGELALLRRLTTAPVSWVLRCALSDVGAKLALVVVGIAGQVYFHVPVAITIVQIIAIDLVALLLPITALGGDSPKKITDKTAMRLVEFGAVSALLTYANFLFFFVRRGISPEHLDAHSLLYFHAATLSFATIVVCRIVNLVMVRSDSHELFFTKHLWSNRKLLVALSFSLLLVVLGIYYGPLQHYLDTQALGILDWFTVLAAGSLFFGLQLLQRHTRKHTRQAVLELHHHVHGRNTA